MFKSFKLIIALSLALTLTPVTSISAETKKVTVTTAADLETALKGGVIDITVKGKLGSESKYKVYEVITPNVTIKGEVGAKVFGSFVVKANGVTIEKLAIQNKGDRTGESSNNRGGVYVFANNVKLLGNTFTNGLGENEGLSNAIQIMSPTEKNPLSNYVIKDNVLRGHVNTVTNWASSGIVIAQHYTPVSAGEYVREIYATEADYLNLLNKNTFENNKIDVTHQDWADKVNPVLFSKNFADYLVDEKAVAITALVKYVSAEKYLVNAEELKNVINVGKLAIENATNVETVNRKLAAAKSEIDKIKTDAELDAELADVRAVDELIAGLPNAKEVAEKDKGKIIAASDAYNALTESDKSKVTLFDKLHGVVTALVNLPEVGKTNDVTITTVDGSVLDPRIELVIKEVKVEDVDMEDLEKLPGSKDKEFLKLFDLSLLLDDEVVQHEGKVQVTIKLTEEDLADFKDFAIVYVDDTGKLTLVPSVVKDGEITFEVGHFSYYAVVAQQTDVDEEVTPPADEEEETTPPVEDDGKDKTTPPVEDDGKDKTPPTGINNQTYLYASIIIGGLVVFFFNRKKRVQNN